MNVDSAAEYLCVSPRYVRRLVRERRVAFHKVGKHLRFDRRDLDALIAAGRVEVGGRIEAARRAGGTT